MIDMVTKPDLTFGILLDVDYLHVVLAIPRLSLLPSSVNLIRNDPSADWSISLSVQSVVPILSRQKVPK